MYTMLLLSVDRVCFCQFVGYVDKLVFPASLNTQLKTLRYAFPHFFCDHAQVKVVRFLEKTEFYRNSPETTAQRVLQR